MLEIIFKYQNLDLTEHMNERLRKLIQRGCYDGGRLTPIAGTLTCTRGSFLAIGYDGTTVRDLQPSTFSYTPGQTNYHVVRAKYNALGAPTTPVLDEFVLSAAAYSTHVDKLYLIVLGVVTLAGGATEVTTADISYALRDEVGPFGRVMFKGTVAAKVNLPNPAAPTTNKIGDCYLVQADWGMYVWTGSIWRLIAAMGASTLDGAYDDNNGSAIPGSGRFIDAANGAVEIDQTNLSQRGQDIANAALRINKEFSSVGGTLGVDLVQGTANPISAIMVREALSNSSYLHTSETVNIASGVGGPITFTRVGVNLNAWTYAGAGILAQLLEIRGSTLGNNGLFCFTVTGNTTGTVRNLDNSAIGMTAESGVMARVYYVRSLLGGVINPLFSAFPTAPSSYELLGNAQNTAFYHAGKVFAWMPNAVDNVLEFRRYDVGTNFLVSRLSEAGGWYANTQTRPAYPFYGEANNGSTDGAALNTPYAGVYGSNGVDNGIGVKGIAVGVNSIGVLGLNANPTQGIGVYGQAGQFSVPSNHGYAGVYGINLADGIGVTGISITGPGVQGTSYGSNGVEGDRVGFSRNLISNASFGNFGVPGTLNDFEDVYIRHCPALTEFRPADPGGVPTWVFSANAAGESYWTSTVAGPSWLEWSWAQYPEGMLLQDVVLDVNPNSSNLSIQVNQRRVGWAWFIVWYPNAIGGDWTVNTIGATNSNAAARTLLFFGVTPTNFYHTTGDFTNPLGTAAKTDKLQVYFSGSATGQEIYGIYLGFRVRSTSTWWGRPGRANDADSR